MTNSTIEQLYRHSSIRRYKPDPLSLEQIKTIIAAAQRSSTSSNLQLYSAVVVTDAEKRNRLSILCGDQDHIRQAPVFIAWCADLSRLERVCDDRGYEIESSYVENLLVSAVDAAVAMQNAAIAAESMGLGMCYIGGIRNNPQGVIELLELPRLVFPVSGMTLGHPAVDGKQRPRLPIDAIMHMESYDCSDEKEAVHAYDNAMVATDIYRGRQVPAPGKEGEMEDYDWSEHSARRVRSCSRTDLREVLDNQGFKLM